MRRLPLRRLALLLPLAGVGALGGAGWALTRDHDELPRVVACQERLQKAVDAMRAAMPGYHFALTVQAAEGLALAGSEAVVTCTLREADNVPGLRAGVGRE
ncbi:MAG: hypothetical protein AAFV49_09290 [Pseudomonadota bacterium]